MGHSLRYARIPMDVLESKSLSDKAKLVYAYMAAWVFEGSVVRIGQRRISEVLGMSRTTVARKISELASAGFIFARTVQRGQRSYYSLASPVFGQKQGKKTVIRSSPRGDRRMVSVAKEDVA